jgi:hypothetical protein
LDSPASLELRNFVGKSRLLISDLLQSCWVGGARAVTCACPQIGRCLTSEAPSGPLSRDKLISSRTRVNCRECLPTSTEDTNRFPPIGILTQKDDRGALHLLLSSSQDRTPPFGPREPPLSPRWNYNLVKVKSNKHWKGCLEA